LKYDSCTAPCTRVAHDRSQHSELQAKMLEYIANGVRLGFLTNPQDRQVEIYRIDRSVEILQSPTTVSGERVLPKFTLDLNSIW
jgi:Uma2 family endonuclease